MRLDQTNLSEIVQFFTNIAFVLLVVIHMGALHMQSNVVFSAEFPPTNIALVLFWQMNELMVAQLPSRCTRSAAFSAPVASKWRR